MFLLYMGAGRRFIVVPLSALLYSARDRHF